jgi:hypothetical protein
LQLLETWQGTLTVVIITVAIMGGGLTAFVRLTDRNTPVDLGLLHGRMGVVGVLLLVVLTVQAEKLNVLVNSAIALFILTVVAGTILYFIIRRKGILPKAIIFVHAALAVCGLAALLFALPF